MAESATDALNAGVNLSEDVDIPVDPFPSVEPFPSDPFPQVDSMPSANSEHGGSSASSKKRKRSAKNDELASLVSKGFDGLLDACAEVKSLNKTDVKVNDARESLPDELAAMGLSNEDYMEAMYKLLGRSDLLLGWCSMNPNLKKDFVLHMVKK